LQKLQDIERRFEAHRSFMAFIAERNAMLPGFPDDDDQVQAHTRRQAECVQESLGTVDT